ncbi:N-acetylmuramoyl-L-alanine amidase [Ferrimonas balearica]|uniref:N-acetylmuramoyl-L-alanine amidase n=1 Tax=Ferrimonas balearica TaxID=44012 RepID=UPI001F3D59EC|nr:N-acetylmuramoyl-L-alanine amidase [Ferrimonas balearica]MBY6095882.1 N-acetylmuramoyl-L-alanine amidase [Ferrimonas balearica]
MKNLSWMKTWVLGLLLTLVAGPALANQLERIRISHSPEKTRVVLDMSGKPSFSAFRLTGPDRLVVDLKTTKLKANLAALEKSSPLIRRIRTSNPQGNGDLRLVLDLTQSASHKTQVLGASPQGYHRLVLDLVPTSRNPSTVAASPGRNVVIAIDAGHGGKDPGSIGPSGTYEKDVVLPIAQKLKAKIDATPGFEAFLVREGDYFVSLDQRSAKARKKKADLLVSIHADAFTSPQPRGASVWVLSLRRANSEMGRWLERDDKLSELRGIGEVISQSSQDDPHLQRTFLDLARENSMMESQALASSMLKQMGQVTRLHKAKPQFASLAVLKSPDFPSLLVETGFISNPHEERQLRDPGHQRKMANALSVAIQNHFRSNPPRDSLLAQRQTHKVQRGESLSVIARRYQVSVPALKQANQLKSDTVRIGQELVIPTL